MIDKIINQIEHNQVLRIRIDVVVNTLLISCGSEQTWINVFCAQENLSRCIHNIFLTAKLANDTHNAIIHTNIYAQSHHNTYIDGLVAYKCILARCGVIVCEIHTVNTNTRLKAYLQTTLVVVWLLGLLLFFFLCLSMYFGENMHGVWERVWRLRVW